jgi:hypothetical protein
MSDVSCVLEVEISADSAPPQLIPPSVNSTFCEGLKLCRGVENGCEEGCRGSFVLSGEPIPAILFPARVSTETGLSDEDRS